MGKFEQSDNGERSLSVSGFANDGREHLECVLPLPLGGDEHARIEDYSHEGGASGSRWLSIAASTSLAKSASMTAVESSGSSAMHSEIVRRGGAMWWVNSPPPLTTHAVSLPPRAPTREKTEAITSTAPVQSGDPT